MGALNANPPSAVAALDVLAAMKGQGRRVAVLGDMLELGAGAADMHQQIGAKAGGFVDLLICVGAFAADVCRGAAATADEECARG